MEFSLKNDDLCIEKWPYILQFEVLSTLMDTGGKTVSSISAVTEHEGAANCNTNAENCFF